MKKSTEKRNKFNIRKRKEKKTKSSMNGKEVYWLAKQVASCDKEEQRRRLETIKKNQFDSYATPKQFPDTRPSIHSLASLVSDFITQTSQSNHSVSMDFGSSKRNDFNSVWLRFGLLSILISCLWKFNLDRLNTSPKNSIAPSIVWPGGVSECVLVWESPSCVDYIYILYVLVYIFFSYLFPFVAFVHTRSTE